MINESIEPERRLIDEQWRIYVYTILYDEKNDKNSFRNTKKSYDRIVNA